MFAIEAKNLKGWRWIAGVFAEQSAAEAFLQAVPEPARAYQRIVELPLTKFPVFVIEDRGFEYGDIGFVRAKLQALVPNGDEDHIHLNVYVVLEDFSPAQPGIDSMGGLLHWHITDWTLKLPRSVVFDGELEELANGA